MPISFAQLIATPALALRTVGQAPGEPERSIEWVAVTELEDPRPFLSGGEVVLTTGVRQRSAEAQRVFVRRVREAGALAIGFGAGLTHSSVPPAVVAEADSLDLPVFEVPYKTPFIAIGKLVADALSRDHYAKLEQLLRSHQMLASALLSGGGLEALLSTLGRMLATDLVLSQYGAEVFTSRPSLTVTADEWKPVTISTGMTDGALLWLRKPFASDEIADYARSLISLELSNQAKHRATERQITGQVLDDIIRGSLTGADAAVRLGAAGVTGAGKHAVLLADGPRSRRALPTLPLPPALAGCASAVVGGQLAVIVAGAAEDKARAFSDYLQSAGLDAAVGQGGSYPQAGGLRWSYFEAREALSRGRRLNRPERLSLTSLLLASDDVPLADLAAEALTPLERFDEKHDGALLVTLQAYLELNGSISAVAQRLRLHRNTVRYRLAQITDLTGYDPAVTADRVHLWLALSVLRLQNPAPAGDDRGRGANRT